MNRPHLIAPSLLAAAALLLAACGGDPSPNPDTNSSASGYPVTVNSCGTDYVYDKAPERVLLGAPGTIATLDALGVADSAIGYTLSDYEYDGVKNFPNLKLTTADWTPSREFLISTQPDLFLSNDEQQLLGEGTASKDDLASVSGNLYVMGDYCVSNPATPTIDIVYQDIENLGTIYDVPDRASDLVTELKARVKDAAALNTTGEKFTAAAITVADGKVYALSGTYYAAILTALGLDNQFADLDSNFAEISTEAVLKANPDVILVTYTGGNDQAAISEASKLFANSAAAADHRIYGLDETDLQSVGVRIIDAIEHTAQNVFTD